MWFCGKCSALLYPFRLVLSPVQLLQLLSRPFAKQPLVVPPRLLRSPIRYRDRFLIYDAERKSNVNMITFSGYCRMHREKTVPYLLTLDSMVGPEFVKPICSLSCCKNFGSAGLTYEMLFRFFDIIHILQRIVCN